MPVGTPSPFHNDSQHRSALILVSFAYFCFIFRIWIFVYILFMLPRFRKTQMVSCPAMGTSSPSHSQQRSTLILVSFAYFCFIFRIWIFVYILFRLPRFRKTQMVSCPAMRTSSPSHIPCRIPLILVSFLYFYFIFRIWIFIYDFSRLPHFRSPLNICCPATETSSPFHIPSDYLWSWWFFDISIFYFSYLNTLYDLSSLPHLCNPWSGDNGSSRSFNFLFIIINWEHLFSFLLSIILFLAY